MKKIISLFKRSYEGDRLVYDEVVEGAEWVISGEGIATRKYDGTCCMVKDNQLYKRHDVKKGKTKPEGFIPAQDPDPITGHWPGWVSVGNGPEDKWHKEVWVRGEIRSRTFEDGTYELVGPKINNNPERFTERTLVKHGEDIIDAPRTFGELKQWFKDKDIEGIVWHHPDGRMVKIKKRDFGYKR